MSYIPVMLQKLDPDAEEWADVQKLYASQVNRAGGAESYAAGREQFHARLVFVLRWRKVLEAVRWEPSAYRLIYGGQAFNILDWDDYMEQHISVKITGEAYG